MKNLFLACLVASLFCCYQAKAVDTFSPSAFSEVRFGAETPIGTLVVYRPSSEEIERRAPSAKEIFVEAFSTTYLDYHLQSGSTDPVEKWLRLKEGLTLESWLSLVFDDEYEEYLAGSKGFLFLCDENGVLLGWLSHSPVSETGELYLSQCSLEAGSRNRRVTGTLFEKALQGSGIKQLFPGVKQVKLITRKVNTVARHLYLKAGFTLDEAIDPSVYGDSYDDRYVGLRLSLDP